VDITGQTSTPSNCTEACKRTGIETASRRAMQSCFLLEIRVNYRKYQNKERVFAMRLQESGEMYLESILVLSLQGKSVRSVDVSEYMGYSKPSVSRAIGLLKSGGYVTVDEDGFLHLTESGRESAEKTYERHRVLTALLEYIGVDAEIAAHDACKIEHNLSDETFEALKRFIEKI